MQNLCTFMTSSKRAGGEWQGMANGIATTREIVKRNWMRSFWPLRHWVTVKLTMGTTTDA